MVHRRFKLQFQKRFRPLPQSLLVIAVEGHWSEVLLYPVETRHQEGKRRVGLCLQLHRLLPERQKYGIQSLELRLSDALHLFLFFGCSNKPAQEKKNILKKKIMHNLLKRKFPDLIKLVFLKTPPCHTTRSISCQLSAAAAASFPWWVQLMNS